MNRRRLLTRALALSALGLLRPVPPFAQQQPPTTGAEPPPPGVTAAGAGQAQPFSVEWLRDHARQLASRPYEPPSEQLPPALRDLSYDQYQAIDFQEDHALWVDDDLMFRIGLFHLGLYFQRPVAIHTVEGGVARPVAYTPELFAYHRGGFDPPLPADLGFAGFRVLFHTDWDRDMAAFLGASYFRAVGRTLQYGLSARGLAIDTGLPRPEEFPDFRAFWLEMPAPDEAALVVHALLDSESVAGAYDFTIRPGRTTTMDVAAHLYPRRPIERLGIAPLTSMYQHGENDRRVADDFRPEIHDSDGLLMWRGNGEWLWRPLINPGELRVNVYLDENPRGFGLLQRDRDFANYQDAEARYHERPDLWIEPLEPWGRGAVQLVEIPTGEEIFDNMVAFWNPERPVEPGTEMRFAYRLHWGDEVPDCWHAAAAVIATRTGIGGTIGQTEGRDTRKFVIDFRGGDLDLLAEDAEVEPVVTVSRGEVLDPVAWRVGEVGGWRAKFDLRAEGAEPVNLRCFLRLGPAALSETWVYQWTPPPAT
ncbi:MAG TPA: glucan biosynthesis protein [Geminicoccaceae bacterium]|nr:glucan biosynthesis protein [Geminicoccaceae bacterium]